MAVIIRGIGPGAGCYLKDLGLQLRSDRCLVVSVGRGVGGRPSLESRDGWQQTGRYTGNGHAGARPVLVAGGLPRVLFCH